MDKILKKLYSSRTLGWLFHTLNYCLEKEMNGMESVLDLGCGPDSPLRYCSGIKYSLGVEIFEPYLAESRQKKIHSEYLQKNIKDLEFLPRSFDAVIALEVLEHLSKKDGEILLEKMHVWSRKKVVVSCPNGFFEQASISENPLQRHLSGWDATELKQKGYQIKGMAGLKYLRNAVGDEADSQNVLQTIRLRPRAFWFLIAAVSQLVTYYVPTPAFGLFAIKTKNNENHE